MRLTYGLGVTSRHLRVGRVFSPSSLFKEGQPGAWFDPSDLTTLFQDAAGSQPVTSPGQPVGLMLEKSRGLVLGPELAGSLPAPMINNHGGSNGVWDGATRTLSNTTTGSDNGFPRFTLNLGLETGRRYQVTGTLTGDIAAIALVRLAAVGAANSVSYDPATGAFVARQLTDGSALQIALNGTFGPSSVEIASISVRELPGAHAAQTISARRPTYQSGEGLHWLSFDGVDDLLLTSAVDLSRTSRLSVFAGVRKLSDAVRGVIVNQTANGSRSFSLYGPNSGGASNFTATAGNTLLANAAVSVTAPATRVLTALHDIGAEPAQSLALNGATPVVNTGNTGSASTFQNGVVGIGGFATNERWFNGRVYGLIVRGAETTPADIARTERFIAAKTGVTL